MAVPVLTPDTKPDVPTVATPVLLLLHVPPVVASDKDVVPGIQTIIVPVMGVIAWDANGSRKNKNARARYLIRVVLCANVQKARSLPDVIYFGNDPLPFYDLHHLNNFYFFLTFNS